MTDQKQTSTIVDLISEGPVEGLVNGDSSIFLNGTPLLDTEERYDLGSVRGTITGSGTSIDFTPNEPFDLTNLRLDLGSRLIVCYGTLSASTAKIESERRRRVLLTTGYSWSDSDIGKTVLLGPSGENPSETFRIVSINNSNNVVLDRPSNGPYNTNRTLYIEEKRTIESVTDSNTIVIDSAFSSTASSDAAIILPVNSQTASTNSGLSSTNFEDVKYIFRSGARNQPVLTGTYGGGRTAFATKFNEEIKQTTRTGTYPVENGANSITKTATTDLSIGNPENIDKIKLSIQFPSLIIYSKIATEYSLGVEFQIYFQYKRGQTWYNHTGEVASISSELQTPFFGVSDNEIQTRDPRDLDDSTPGQQRVGKWSLSSDSFNSGVFRQASKSEVVKEFEINIEPFKPFIDFRVRIKRVTEVNVAVRNESQGQSQSYLQSIFAYSNDVLNFSNSAVAAIKIGSTEFDSIPERSYLTRGLKIQVPTNYFPAVEAGELTGKYTRNKTTGVDTGNEQTWDGKFRGDIADTSWRSDAGNINYFPVYCNNPAWVYYDLMVNNRYGLGDYVTAQDINKYDLYRIARYCDELVPDGKGGQEPRFSCNLYIQSRTEAFKVINDLASIFRSIVKWNNGQISAVQDAPRGPVYTFSNSNVIGGEFAYESTSKRLRINQVGVTWNNPDKFYKQDVVNVEDSEAIIEDGRIIKKDTIAVGCTSEGQATRLGKWMMLTERLETELIKFRTGINGAYLRPGDIIYVQDYNRTNAAASGRLARTDNHTTTTLYFDRAIPLEIDDYQLHLAFTTGAAYLQQDEATINGIEYAQGDLVTQAYIGGVLTNINSEEDASNALDAASGDHVLLHWSENISVESRDFTSASVQNVNSITVSSAFSSVPNSEVMFTLTNVTDTNTAKGSKKYRVLNISENDDKTIDISGHIYLDDKFSAVDRGYLVQEPEFNPLPTFDNVRVPPPQNVTVSITRITEGNDDRNTQGDNSFDFSATVAWGYPRIEGQDEVYNYIDYFEIKHPFNPNREYNITRGDKTSSITFNSFVTEQDSTVLVRTVNILGRRSAWAEGYLKVDTNLPGSSVRTLNISGISTGGSVGSSISVDPVTGDISFSDDNFTVIGPFGQTSYSLTSVPDVLQGSPEMSADSYTYVLFDQDIQEFKLVELEVDEVAEDPSTGLNPGLDFEYWKEFNGSTTFNSEGTITQDIDIIENDRAVFTNQFTVSLANPDNLSPGDTIRIGSGADSWYGTISSKTNSSITTTQYINKDFNSGEQIYSFDFVPDLLNDFIIARMYRNNISPFLYELDTFATFKGISGVSARVVKLVGEDTTIVYNGEGEDPQYNSATPGTIVFTATEQGYDSPQFRFKEGSDDFEDWDTTNTYNYSVPTTLSGTPFDTTPVTLEVEVREGSSGTDIATDKVSIISVYNSSGVLTLTYNNSSHVVPTDNDFTNAAFGGSGGTIEVFQGSNLLTYNATQASYPTTAGKYNLYIDRDTGDTSVSAGSFDGTAGTSVTLADFTSSQNPDRLNGLTVFTLSAYIRTLFGKNLLLTKKISLAPSRAGQEGVTPDDARVIQLIAEDNSITYDSQGANPSYSTASSNGRISLTTEDQGYTSPQYRFTVNGSTGSWSGTDSYDYLVPTTLSGTPFDTSATVIKVEVREGTDDSTIASDQTSIVKVVAGTRTITVSADNTAHVVRADANGNNPVLSGSGITFEVFEGATQLEYDAGATPDNGTYKITIVETNVTADTNPSISTDNTTITYGDITAFTADSGNIVFTVTIKDTEGNTTTRTVQQSFSKSLEGAAGSSGFDAQAVKLTADRYTVVYNSAGNAIDSSAIALSAEAINFEDSPEVQFRFYKDGDTQLPSFSTTPTDSLSIPLLNSTETYIVEAGSGGSPVEASDSITVVALQEGGDAITISYDNDSHVVPTNTDYTGGDFTGSGGSLRIFQGATPLTFDGIGTGFPTNNSRYNLDINRTSGDSNVTKGTLTGTGTTTANVPDFSSGSTINTATVFTITAKITNDVGSNTTLTQKISLSPSNTGSDGKPGIPGASVIIAYDHARENNETIDNAGEYKFSNSSNPTASGSGTIDWAEITGTYVTHIHLNDAGTSSGNQDTYLVQLQEGDTITWFDTENKWVEFIINNTPTDNGGIWTFPVALVEYEESEDTEFSGDDAVSIDWRFSRAPAGIPSFVNHFSHTGVPGKRYADAYNTVDSDYSIIHGTVGVTSTNAAVGGSTHFVTCSTTTEDDKFSYGTFAPNTSTYNLNLPANRRWLLGAYVRHNAAETHQMYLTFLDNNGDSKAVNYPYMTPSAVDTTEWKWAEQNLQSTNHGGNTKTQFKLSYATGRPSNGVARTVYIDGITLIDVTDFPQYTASYPPPIQYIEPSMEGPDGEDAYTVVASPEFYSFLADSTGAISSTSGFSLTFDVKKGSTTYSYASSGSTSGTYSYGNIVGTNVGTSTDANGTISVTTGTLMSGTSTTTGSIQVPIIDNGTSTTIATKTIGLSKSIAAARDGATFTFRRSGSTYISSDEAADWADDLSDLATATSVAAEVINVSTDGFIRPNDRITVYDDSATPPVAGTRIYTGSATTSSSSQGTADYSSLVVDVVDGSLIVEGTLSADTLAANTTITNTLNIGSILELAPGGKIRTEGTTYGQGTGVFLGENGTIQKFRAGTPGQERIEWDGTTATISGTLVIDNTTTLTESNTLNGDDAEALAFNGKFTEFTSGLPTGWYAPQAIRNLGGWSQNTDSDYILSGSSSLKGTTGGSASGRYLTRSHDSTDTTGNHIGPDIKMRFPPETEITFSCDVYLENSSGNMPSILFDLCTAVDTSQNPDSVAYFRTTVFAQSINDKWQKLQGRVSQQSFTSSNDSPTVGDDILFVRGVVVMPGGFNGEVYFDNFNWHVSERSSNNGETVDEDGNIAGGMTMINGGSIVIEGDNPGDEIRLDGGDKLITIKDGGTVRVKLGKLS